MIELNRMIAECEDLRLFHRQQRLNGVRGAGIEGLAVVIRERALKDARQAILDERKS